jgi:hypothetical protein
MGRNLGAARSAWSGATPLGRLRFAGEVVVVIAAVVSILFSAAANSRSTEANTVANEANAIARQALDIENQGVAADAASDAGKVNLQRSFDYVARSYGEPSQAFYVLRNESRRPMRDAELLFSPDYEAPCPVNGQDPAAPVDGQDPAPPSSICVADLDAIRSVLLTIPACSEQDIRVDYLSVFSRDDAWVAWSDAAGSRWVTRVAHENGVSETFAASFQAARDQQSYASVPAYAEAVEPVPDDWSISRVILGAARAVNVGDCT